MVIRASASALAVLFAIGCVQIIDLEVGQRREAATTTASGGQGGSGHGGGGGASGPCRDFEGDTALERFCDKYCFCVEGGEPCMLPCIGMAGICPTEAIAAVDEVGLDRCCSTLCAEVEHVRDYSCWEPPQSYPSGCN